MNFFSLTALALLAFVVSCSKSDQQTKDAIVPKIHPRGTQAGETLIFSCLHPDYGYMVRINGEPVQVGTSPGYFEIRSFPLKNGTNQISINLSFLPKQGVPPRSKLYVFDWSLRTRVKDDIPLVHTYKSGFAPYNTNLSWDEYVVITNVASPTIEFESLGDTRVTAVDECCKIARKMAELLRTRNKAKLAAIFSLSEDDVARQFAEFERWTEMSVSSGQNNAEVSAVCGEYFVVVFCGKDEEVNIGESFVAFSPMESNQLTSFAIDHMVFARKSDSWVIRGLGGSWLTINTNEVHSL